MKKVFFGIGLGAFVVSIVALVFLSLIKPISVEETQIIARSLTAFAIITAVGLAMVFFLGLSLLSDAADRAASTPYKTTDSEDVDDASSVDDDEDIEEEVAEEKAKKEPPPLRMETSEQIAMDKAERMSKQHWVIRTIIDSTEWFSNGLLWHRFFVLENEDGLLRKLAIHNRHIRSARYFMAKEGDEIKFELVEKSMIDLDIKINKHRIPDAADYLIMSKVENDEPAAETEQTSPASV